jgi:hypothetical protein
MSIWEAGHVDCSRRLRRAQPLRLLPTAADLTGSAPSRRVQEQVLALQRSAGNRAVSSLLAPYPRVLARAPTLDVEPVDTTIHVPLEGSGGNRLDIDASVMIESDAADPHSPTGRYHATDRFSASGSGPLGLSEPIEIKAGSRSTLHFYMKSKLHIKGDPESDASVDVTWSITADKHTGALTIKQIGRPQVKSDVRGRARLGLDKVEGGIDEKSGTMFVGVDYKGAAITQTEGTTSKGRTIGTPSPTFKVRGVEVEVPSIPLWQGDDEEKTEEKAYVAPMLSRDFLMELKVTGVEPIKQPPAPKTRKRTWWVLFKEERNVDVPAAEERWLHKWWDSLRPQTREALKNGSKSLTLEGYASTTGSSKGNRARAQKRIDSVMEILNAAAGMQGGKSLIKTPPETHAYGEGRSDDATDVRQEETGAAFEKRVEIAVDDLVTTTPDAAYDEVEREMIGRGEARQLEREELAKKRQRKPVGAGGR